MKKLYTLSILIGITLSASSQNFLNGSFENTVANNCFYNIDNHTFDSLMADVKGIGAMETLDIFYDVACATYGLAQQGNYYASLENTSSASSSTSFSLKLGSNLVAGTAYTFCYWDRGFSGNEGPVEIGVSATNNTFGTLIYTSPTANTSWTQRTVSFTSPITAGYITARYQLSNVFSGLGIDNFGICTTGISEDLANENIISIAPNPATNQLTVTSSANNIKEIKIINVLGEEVLLRHTELVEGQSTINISTLPKGIYFVQVTDEHKTIVNKKVVVQ